jgi:hypothetical protein
LAAREKFFNHFDDTAAGTGRTTFLLSTKKLAYAACGSVKYLSDHSCTLLYLFLFGPVDIQRFKPGEAFFLSGKPEIGSSYWTYLQEFSAFQVEKGRVWRRKAECQQALVPSV